MAFCPAGAPSDEDLALRAQQGCAASFEQLVRRFQTPVLSLLRRQGAGRDAEDVLQETFVRAYSNLCRYRPRWRFATWLFTIARRMAINHYRRTRPLAGGERLESLESPDPGPCEQLADRERRERLAGLWDIAARILSEEQMTALWLYYVERMSAGEIAAVLERSRVSVKTMLFRARKSLVPLLRGLDPAAPAHDPAVSNDQEQPGDCPQGGGLRGVEVPHVQTNSRRR